MARTIWNDVLERIQTKVNNYTYQTWFEPTSLSQDTGSSLVIQVADLMAVEWMTKHYTALIAEALAEVGRPGVSFRFMPEGDAAAVVTGTGNEETPADIEQDAVDTDGAGGLSPR